MMTVIDSVKVILPLKKENNGTEPEHSKQKWMGHFKQK